MNNPPTETPAPSAHPPRVFASEALAKFLLAGRLELLLAVVGKIVVPFAVFNYDPEDPEDRTSQPSDLRRLLDVCSTLLNSASPFSISHRMVSLWYARLAVLYELASQEKLVIVGGQDAGSYTPEELQELAGWGDLDIGASAGGMKSAVQEPPGLVRLEMGVQESMAGAGIWDDSRPEGPPEAQALALARFRGWEAVSDSPTTHSAARLLNESVTKSQVPARCVGTSELVAQAVLDGFISHGEAARVRAELAVAAQVFGWLSRELEF